MNARRILTISSLLLHPISQAAEWEKLPPLPEPNGGFAVVEDHGQLLVAGGTRWQDGRKLWLNKVWRYEPANRRWLAQPDLPHAFAYGIAGVSRLPSSKEAVPVLGGGSDAQGGRAELIWLRGAERRDMRVNLPAQVVLAAGGVQGHHLFFAGGTADATQIAAATNATWSLDLASLQVQELPACPGPAFVTAASVMDGRGRLFVFGGGTWEPESQSVRNLDRVAMLDVNTGTWSTRRSMPFAARGMSAVVVSGPQASQGGQEWIYVAGGYPNDATGFSDEAFLHDPVQDRYHPAPPLPYRAMVSLVVCEGFVYCLGGEDRKQSRTAACYRLPVAALLK